MEHLSRRMKVQLRRLVDTWNRQGIIESDQAARIYRLHDLENARAVGFWDIFLGFVYIVGAVLIGVGVISFVAFHWSGMNRWLKLTLISLLMAGFYISGFVFWRGSGKMPRLGHTLTLIGTLVFGANIGLVSQIFHIRGQVENAFLVWAIGAFAAGYLLWSSPNMVVGCAAMFCWFVSGVSHYLGGELWYFPLVFVAALVPFIVLKRSNVLLVLVLLSLCFYVPAFTAGERWGYYFVMSVSGLSLLYIGLGMVDPRFRAGLAGGGLRVLGVFLTATVLFFVSFHEIAKEIFDEPMVFNWKGMGAGLLVFGLPALAVWLWGLYSRRSEAGTVCYYALAGLGSIGLCLLYAIGNAWSMTAFANVVLFALAGTMIWKGFSAESRGYFWSAVLLIGVLIFARTVEYRSGLLIKAAVFTGSGIAVVTAGILFERFLKGKEVQHAG